MTRRIPALLAAVVGLAALAFGALASPGANADLKAAKSRCDALAGGRWAEVPGAPTWITKTIYRAKTETSRAHCEVEGYVNPQVYFGMLMPEENWNGKYLMRGCGGSCGAVPTEGACGKHLRDGYACIITDMGHRSTQIDNNWTANNLQGQVDFGFRSTHVTAVVGKLITAAYYQKEPTRSYFYGCSTGGRQALVEAQRFPEDFDGIVAVAPASMGPFGARRANANNPNPNRDTNGQAILPDTKVPLIYKAVIAKCDKHDGVQDGLLDPRDCDFDPAILQCKGADTVQCLTAAQVAVARKFYARGAQPGSELNWINNWTAKPGPAQEFAQSRGDPAIIETFDHAANPDLRAFKARKGKLILTHGSTDLVVPGGPSLDYYELATRTMGGLESTKEFFRFFVIPGMDHCSGGDGAWGVDYIGALDNWVEKGQAPEKLVGVHPRLGVALDYFGLDTRLLKPDEIAFTRPYFPHPLRAYYSGKGDPGDEKNFVAALSPPQRLASAAASAARPPNLTEDQLTAKLSQLVALSEETYSRGVALPPKNVSDRIGKALRRAIYTSQAAESTVAKALTRVSQEQTSDIAQTAIKSLQAEFPLAK